MPLGKTFPQVFISNPPQREGNCSFFPRWRFSKIYTPQQKGGVGVVGGHYAQSTTLLRKWLDCWCFPLNLAKVFRPVVLWNTCEQLLLWSGLKKSKINPFVLSRNILKEFDAFRTDALFYVSAFHHSPASIAPHKKWTNH